MPLFRFDVNRQSGIVTLLSETGCGMKPVFMWADLDGVKEFAEMLLNFYNDALNESSRIREVSDQILRQAFDDGDCSAGPA